MHLKKRLNRLFQIVDDIAFDIEGMVIDKIKRNYLKMSHVPEDAFQLKIIGKCRVIGPFANSKMAESIIKKINGYCSSKKSKEGE